jgi:hypothetical protein
VNDPIAPHRGCAWVLVIAGFLWVVILLVAAVIVSKFI